MGRERADQGPTVAQAAGVDNDETVWERMQRVHGLRDDDSILDHQHRVRPSVYGGPTEEMRQRDLDRVTRRPR